MTEITLKQGTGAPNSDDLVAGEVAIDNFALTLYSKDAIPGVGFVERVGINDFLALDGGNAMKADIDLDAKYTVTNVKEPSADGDVATKLYVDELIGGGAGSGNPVVISDQAPADAEVGDLWFCSLQGEEGLFCYNSEDPQGEDGYWFEVAGAKGEDGINGIDGAEYDDTQVLLDISTLQGETTALVAVDVDLQNQIDTLEDSIVDGGGFVDAPDDAKLYGRKSEEWEEIVIPDTDLTGYATETYVDDSIAAIDFPDGAGMLISDTEPANPVEGTQWLNSDTAEVYIWDGAAWLEFPAGSGGSVGGLWEANGDDVYYSLGNVGVGTSDPSQKLTISDVSAPVYISQNRGNVSSLVGPDGADGGLYIGTTSDHEVRLHTSGERRLTIDTAGNVGVGTDDPKGILSVANANGGVFEFLPSSDNNFIRSYDRTASSYVPYAVQALTHSFNMGNNNSALFINDAGDATFAGTVSAKRFNLTDDRAVRIELNDASNALGKKWIRSVSGRFDVVCHDYSRSIFVVEDNGDTTIRGNLISQGDATFSGAVDAREINRNGYSGIHFTTNYLLPMDSTGAFSTGKVDLGNTSYKFKNGYFSGTVTSTRMTQDGAPVIDAKGLITTLSTLRNATKDETTVKGLRDAISDAIGGLIEKFENEIATMPAGDES